MINVNLIITASPIVIAVVAILWVSQNTVMLQPASANANQNLMVKNVKNVRRDSTGNRKLDNCH